MKLQTVVTCNICQREISKRQCLPAGALRPALSAYLKKSRVDWNPAGFVCMEDLNRVRGDFVEHMLLAGKGALSRMESGVLKSLRDEQLLTRELRQESQDGLNLGQRMADRVASFGGSWRFLISFSVFLLVWIGLNSAAGFYLHRSMDPFPFILLNLVLSCLAAVQGPIIMMSQNRLEARDRKRGENDYQINLKAELEIRNLHEKMDHLLEHQWQYLMEIQQVQVELMEEIARHKR